MKKTMLLVFIVLLPLLLLARPERVLREHNVARMMQSDCRAYRMTQLADYYYYDTTWNPGGVYEYFYNPQHPARVDSTRYKWWDSYEEEWVWEGTEAFQYDDNGNLVHAMYYYSDGYTTELEWEATFVYDAQQRLIHEYDTGYDGDGSITEIYRTHVIWGPQSCTTYGYEYSSWDRETSYSWGICEFDAQGRCVVATNHTSPDSVNWTPDYRGTYSYQPYDISDFTDFTIWVSHNYLAWLGLGELQGFGYGAMMLAQTTESMWNGREWEAYWREHYTRDEVNHMLIQTLSEDYYNDVWSPSGRHDFTYDANGNPVEVMNYWWEESSWYMSSKYVATWEYAVETDDPATPQPQSISLKLWPLPFQYGINILPLSDKAGPVDVEIYNVKGQMINKYQATNGTPVYWDGSDGSGRNCSNGVYLIRAHKDGVSTVSRAVKIK